MSEKKNFVDINGNLIEDNLCVEDDSHGLMCPEDKVKLDGIEEGANKVEALTDEEIDAICDFDGVAESGTIPVATKAALGCVVAGDGLDIDEDGVLSVTSKIQDSVPIGSIVEWNGDIIPENWLLLNGQAVSRTGYAELFALYGTKYGEGDGSTTFNLPDYRRRVPVGMDETDTDFDELGNTGGEKAHSHTLGVETPLESGDRPYADLIATGSRVLENYITVPSRNMQLTFGFSSTQATANEASDYAVPVYGTTDGESNLQPYIVTNFIVKAKLYKSRLLPDGMIVDSLTSDSSTDALSALQGKELNEKIDNTNNYLSDNSLQLIAYGRVYNTASQSSSIAKDTSFNFSSNYIPSKKFDITNYIDDILVINGTTYQTFGVNLKGIVGLVEVTVSYSGLGGTGITGLWFKGSAVELPAGVTLPSDYGRVLLGGLNGANYGGNSHTFHYAIDLDTVPDDANFKIDPQAVPYGGTFSPCNGGVACSMSVKVFGRRKG